MVLVSDQMTSMYPQAILHTFGYIYQIDVQSLFDIHSSNCRPLTSLSQITLDLRVHLYFQIGIFSKSSDLWPIYCYQIDVLFKTKNCMCFYLVIWWMLVKSVRPHFWHENVSALVGLSHHTVRTITDYYSIRIMYLPYNLFWRYSVYCSLVF